jgi:hypothetical protein
MGRAESKDPPTTGVEILLLPSGFTMLLGLGLVEH